MNAVLIGFVWGLCEGTWFFIVPDIALSFLALKGLKVVLWATIATILGAMVAATLLWTLFYFFPNSFHLIEKLWSHLPGYYPKMMNVASAHLKEHGAQGLISGPSSGIPYRFYIYEAFKQNISWTQLMLWSPIARLERIIIAPMASLLLRFFAKKLLVKKLFLKEATVDRGLSIVIALYWCALYFWYWVLFLPKVYG